jgi:hypothetical protein
MAADQVMTTEAISWGDTVRVKPGAPAPARPGALAEVVGIREVADAKQARQFGATIGTKLVLIEFADGASVEIPETWLESA